LNIWSTARYDLGLTDEQFWRLTPRQYSYLLKRHRQKSEHEELLAAIIARSVVDFSFCHPAKPSKYADYMPSKWGRKEPRGQVIERLKAQFRQAKQIGAQHSGKHGR
jgi:hypothetical protein